MTHYRSLTIGPISPTLASAKSTKALWSASYLFSWLMREMLQSLRADKSVALLNLPDHPPLFEAGHGVGLFSDRLTMRLLGGASPDLAGIAKRAVKTLAEKMARDLNNAAIQPHSGEAPPPAINAAALEAHLNQYLRILSASFELPTDETNPVGYGDAFLNSLELRPSLVPTQKQDYLSAFFEDLYYNFFIREEFDRDGRGFPSTLEVATATFQNFDGHRYQKARKALRNPSRSEEQAAQENFVREVKAIDERRFKLCHKYLAIVRADGDHVGHLFKTLLAESGGGNNRSATDLANALAIFSLDAAQKIRAVGGVPVYAGGDDLLFFAPVSYDQEVFVDRWERKSIFDLLDDIDASFKQHVLDAPLVQTLAGKLGDKLPSMSYGVSISHHKYPLAESLQEADRLLFGNIKAEGNRNGIAWRILKHSGSGFGLVGQKNSKTHGRFKDLLHQPLREEEQKNAFLSSVMFKLESLEGLFAATAHQHREHFHHIVFNNFNESVHRQNGALSPFLQKAVALLEAVFDDAPVGEQPDRAKAVKANLDRAYAAMRFVHFLETSDKD